MEPKNSGKDEKATVGHVSKENIRTFQGQFLLPSSQKKDFLAEISNSTAINSGNGLSIRVLCTLHLHGQSDFKDILSFHGQSNFINILSNELCKHS